MIRHPALELVGVLVYDPAKAGVDAGVLCGEEPVGVAATDDPAAITALEADCVLYMPRVFDIDDVVALLEAGTNIVTTRGELFGGGHRLGDEGRARRRRVRARQLVDLRDREAAPGSSPRPFRSRCCRCNAASTPSRSTSSPTCRRDSPHLLFEQMGFGKPLDSYNPNRAAYLVGEFSPSLALLAEAAGRPVDEWTGTGEVAAARRTTALVAGELPAGSVAAQRTTVVGKSDGVEVVRFSANWYCTTDVEPAWDLRPTGWRVRVRGDAPFDVDLTFPVPLEDLGSVTPAYTANRPVNAIPYVCAARAGHPLDDRPAADHARRAPAALRTRLRLYERGVLRYRLSHSREVR